MNRELKKRCLKCSQVADRHDQVCPQCGEQLYRFLDELSPEERAESDANMKKLLKSLQEAAGYGQKVNPTNQ